MKTCTGCHIAKDETEFSRKRGSYSSRCKACHNAYYRDYWKQTEAYEKHKRRKNDWQRANKSKIYAAKYGISPEQFERGMANPCEICKEAPAQVVDHDHETGKFRGFLCSKCNRSLGGLGDSLSGILKVVAYLSGDELDGDSSTLIR